MEEPETSSLSGVIVSWLLHHFTYACRAYCNRKLPAVTHWCSYSAYGSRELLVGRSAVTWKRPYQVRPKGQTVQHPDSNCQQMPRKRPKDSAITAGEGDRSISCAGSSWSAQDGSLYQQKGYKHQTSQDRTFLKMLSSHPFVIQNPRLKWMAIWQEKKLD